MDTLFMDSEYIVINSNRIDINPSNDAFSSTCVDVYCENQLAGIPNYPTTEVILFNPIDSSVCNAEDMLVEGFVEEMEGFPNYAYIITGPEEEGKRPIVGASFDGTWDYILANGERAPYGEYCMTGFGYDQDVLDKFTNNSILCIVYSETCDDYECFNGNENFVEFIEKTINNIRYSVCEEPTDSIEFDIDTFLCILRTELPVVTGESFCAEVSTKTHCFEYIEGSSECNKVGVSTVQEGFGKINVYPNPVSDKINLMFVSDKNTKIGIDVYDVSGKLIYSNVENVSIGINQFSINAELFKTGFYFAKISSDDDVVAVKFLKE